ncbi:hypothetical protein ACHBTE_16900 [Streptomyces sp. M41]|uniref:hypothetical protein n=1 Tax=Streptomyces sp. M41 TaxID=3059412 RepID=UPI00374DAE08
MFLLLLLFVVVAVIIAFALCGHGVGALSDRGIRHTGAPGVLRALAALAGAGACALYAWGLLGVAGAVMEAEDGGTDSSPAWACRTPGWAERHQRGIEIVDHGVSFLPLGFVCETSDGGSYDTGDVPSYVNPGVLGLALAAAGCVVGAGCVSELRARAEPRKGTAG